MHAFELLSRQVTKTGTNAPSLLVVVQPDDGIDPFCVQNMLICHTERELAEKPLPRAIGEQLILF